MSGRYKIAWLCEALLVSRSGYYDWIKRRYYPGPRQLENTRLRARIREALRTIIDAEAGLVVVAEADGGRAAIDLFERNRPDVILMDGSMPEMNGIETTRRLKHLEPKVKIIGLTLYSQSTYLEEMVAVGASGYLVKTGSPENLINAIRVVDNGGT